MRKTDRDRDGVLRPDQIETFLEKFNIPLQGVLDHLQRRFADEKFEGMTNYENLVKYFNDIKAKTEQTKPHPTVEKEPPTDKNSTKTRQTSNQVVVTLKANDGENLKKNVHSCPFIKSMIS